MINVFLNTTNIIAEVNDAPIEIVVKGERGPTGPQGPAGDGSSTAWGQITGTLANQTDLQTALNGKAATVHTHTISDVTGLQTALDGKAATVHTHTIANVINLQTTLDGKAALVHTHVISDVTGLQTALDGKQVAGSYAAAVHSHVMTDVTDIAPQGRTFLAATTTALQRTALGLGALATLNTADTGDIAALAITNAKIAANTIANNKMAQIAQGIFKGRTSSGTGNVEDMTATQATALLDVATTTVKGLVPAPGSTTGKVLQDDMTWVTPSGGGGTPGGSTTQVQFNNAGAFGGAANVKIESNNLRLDSVATPSTPAAGGLNLFGRNLGGRIMPAFVGPSGLASTLQPHVGRNRYISVCPIPNSTTPDFTNTTSGGVTGTNTGFATTTASFFTSINQLRYLVTVAATTAVAGFRSAQRPFYRARGFHYICRWGQATGASTATKRAFVGLCNATAAPTDIDPSTIQNIVGMGWDAADTNVQIFSRGTGSVTKVDTGIAIPLTDELDVFELVMFAPPGSGQDLYWEVNNLRTGVQVTGTIANSTMPTDTTLLTYNNYVSVGGTSSVCGMALMSLYIETDF